MVSSAGREGSGVIDTPYSFVAKMQVGQCTQSSDLPEAAYSSSLYLPELWRQLFHNFRRALSEIGNLACKTHLGSKLQEACLQQNIRSYRRLLLTGRRNSRTLLADMRTRAAAPSDMGLALPAVTDSEPPNLPFSEASLAGSFRHGPSSLDTVVDWPLLPGTVIGSSSCIKPVFLQAFQTAKCNTQTHTNLLHYGKQYIWRSPDSSLQN